MCLTNYNGHTFRGLVIKGRALLLGGYRSIVYIIAAFDKRLSGRQGVERSGRHGRVYGDSQDMRCEEAGGGCGCGCGCIK